MFGLDTLILIITLAANLLLGLLVMSRGLRSSTNVNFFMLVLMMSVWSIANILSYRHPNSVFYARFVLFFAVGFAASFYLFAISYPKTHSSLNRLAMISIFGWSAFIMILTLTPLVFKSLISTIGSTIGRPDVGPAIVLFGITVVFFDIGGLVALLKKAIKSRSEERLRRVYLFSGFALMLITIIMFNFLFPSILGNTIFIPYAPLFTLPFVALTSYAIIKHHLLDIKSAAARGLTYILSLSSLGILYGLLTTLILEKINKSSALNFGARSFLIGFALLTALIFPMIKSLFDRVTSKIFFRDGYDSQEFLDALNGILVSKLEPEELIKNSSKLIKRTLKSKSIYFALNDTKSAGNIRIFGDKLKEPMDKEIIRLTKLFTNSQSKLVSIDELYSEVTPQLILDMRRLDVGIVSKLMANKQYIGCILIGSRQGGDAYVRQDTSVINIASDELAIAIQNSLRYYQILEFNKTLQQKITNSTSQLRKINDRLRALDEAKDDFVSMASHQLRTPLTSVKGNISLVLDGDAGDISDIQRQLLQQAFSSSQRMVYLIADLLNVSRLKTGKFVIDHVPLDLASIVEDEVNQLQDSAKSRDLVISYKKPEHITPLMLDDNKTRQVIMNFIDNAIYYTPQGGRIDVYLTETNSSVECRIVDNGIGVPKDEQHHLFTKFYRAGNARKARPDGTGLGLFMAKKVIVSEGGSIIFASQEGKGSTFGFSFPKASLAVENFPKGNLSSKQPLIVR